MNPSRFAAPALLVALSLPAQAQDRRAQYRLLELADGRQITAEVLATEATGLRLRTPQGEMLLTFELLKDMAPADADTFKLQEAWFVYVAAPPDHQAQLLEAFRWVPNTRVAKTGEALPGLDGSIQSAAGKCKTDFPCLLQKTAEADWMYVVSVTVDDDGKVTANTGVNTGPTRVRVEKDALEPQALYELAYESLMLEVPEDGPPESAFSGNTNGNETGPGPTGPVASNDKLLALTFAPVPGLAAAKQNNGSGVGAAVAITAAGTAAWVGAVGHTAQSAPELAGLSLVGFYATTVLANQITLKR